MKVESGGIPKNFSVFEKTTPTIIKTTFKTNHKPRKTSENIGCALYLFFASRPRATSTITTTATATTACARIGGMSDRVGNSRNQYATSKECTTLPKRINKKDYAV